MVYNVGTVLKQHKPSVNIRKGGCITMLLKELKAMGKTFGFDPDKTYDNIQKIQKLLKEKAHGLQLRCKYMVIPSENANDYVAMLISGNDRAIAAARKIFESEQIPIESSNKKALRIRVS